MPRWIIRCLLPVLLLGGMTVRAQTIDPASDACTCDGSVTFSSPLPAPVFFQVNDPQGVEVWSGLSVSGTVTVPGLCAGIYFFTAVSGGQNATDMVQVTAIGANAGTAAVYSICSTASPVNMNNLVAGITAGGTWTNPAGAATDNLYTPFNEAPGFFTYTVPINGCLVQTGVWITEIQNSSAGLSTTYLICENYAPFFMTDVMTGNPDPGGQWYGAGAVPMDGWFDPATMNTGLYTYSVPGVPGCEPVFSTLFIIENLVPDPGIDNTVLVCPGAPPFPMVSQLAGTPDGGGTWYNSSNQVVDGTFDPATDPEGEYRYHVDGDTPCTDQDAYLTVTFTTTNPSGSNGSVALCESDAPVNLFNFLGGSPVNGGTWRNPQNQVVDAFFNPATEAAGNYSYYYPNVGCNPQNVIVAVSVESLPNAGPDNTVTLCIEDASYLLTSALGAGVPTSGSWYTGGLPVAPLVVFTGTGSTVYTYVLTGTECPSDQSAVTLNIQPSTPQPDDLSVLVCSTSGILDLAGYYPTFPDATFQLGGSAVNTFDPSVTGSSVVTVLQPGSGSCPATTATFSITVEQAPFITSQVEYPVCLTGQPIDLSANGFPADYSGGTWTDGQGDDVLNPVDIPSAGSYTFTFTTPAGAACVSSVLTVQLTASEPVNAGGDNSLQLCSWDGAVELDGLLSPGADDGNWITAGGTPAPGSFDPSTDVSQIFYHVVPANGSCPPDSATLEITVVPFFVVDAGPDLSACAGSPGQVIGSTGQAGISYSWSPGTGLSAVNVAQPTVSFDAGTVTYTLTGTLNGCTTSDAVSVTSYALPVLTVPSSITACAGELVTLGANGATTYLWEPASLFADPTAPLQTLLASADATISVTASSAEGCTTAAVIDLHVLPVPAFGADPLQAAGCPPFLYTAGLSELPDPAGTISWTVDGTVAGTGDSLAFWFGDAGSYDLGVSVTTPEGCTTALDFPGWITVHPLPQADFSFSPESVSIIDPTVSFTDGSWLAEEYAWDFGGAGTSTEASPQFTFPLTDPGLFPVCLEVTSVHGCQDSICRFVPVTNEHLLFAPNAFTPDNDGLNEVFLPFLLGYEEESYHLLVFDRWGTVVFESRDPESGWTGNVRGGSYYAQEGVYNWLIEVKDSESAEYQTFRGHVTLIR